MVVKNDAFNGWVGDRSIRIDVRIIAATSKNLHEMVGRKDFREDPCP